MKGRLEGKVAIVTGAGCVGPGWGNGRAVAVRFAREGAKVLAVDINADAMAKTLALARGAAGEIRTWTGDATHNADVQALVEACLENYGRIDILVNNVGGSRRGGPVDLSEEDWDAQIDFNQKSVFLSFVKATPGAHSLGLHGRRHRHRQRHALPGVRRGPLHYRHRDRRGRRHECTVRLIATLRATAA